MELLPRDQIAFQRMLDTIRRNYERFGFLPVETPVFELSEVLLTKSGGETERQVYFAQSTGALAQANEGLPELALRFDLTVPLARYVAEHEHELAFPFRRYQMQRVYRGERAQRGRFREFYQCDIDVIGKDELSIRFDAEVLAVIHAVFSELQIGAFTVQLNNRKLMRGFFENLGVADGQAQMLVLREVDKLDKRGADYVRETLTGEGFGLSGEVVEQILAFVAVRSTGHDDALAQLDRLGQGSAVFNEGIAELREVLTLVKALGVPESAYCLNFSIARGLDYYTGTVYETQLDAYPQIGSICSGGRYENLASHYSKSKLPGVGISIGLTRLFWQLREAGTDPGSRRQQRAGPGGADGRGAAARFAGHRPAPARRRHQHRSADGAEEARQAVPVRLARRHPLRRPGRRGRTGPRRGHREGPGARTAVRGPARGTGHHAARGTGAGERAGGTLIAHCVGPGRRWLPAIG